VNDDQRHHNGKSASRCCQTAQRAAIAFRLRGIKKTFINIDRNNRRGSIPGGVMADIEADIMAARKNSNQTGWHITHHHGDKDIFIGLGDQEKGSISETSGQSILPTSGGMQKAMD
jgi:hypothetical protein